jgi:hypothetical protein
MRRKIIIILLRMFDRYQQGTIHETKYNKHI